MRNILILTVLASIGTPAIADRAMADPAMANPATIFKTAKIDLPTGDRVYVGGNAAEAINANCITCHSAGMVLNQPHLSRAEWTAEVTKMINVYKAPVEPDAAAAVIAYLVDMKPGG